jgi:hypothetical protein
MITERRGFGLPDVWIRTRNFCMYSMLVNDESIRLVASLLSISH